MNDLLSTRATELEPSATMAVSAKAKELSSQGHDVISLGVGEPDFDTPDFIKQAAIEAITEGFTKYTAVDGIQPLKKAIAHKLKRDNRLNFELDQIIVTAGVKPGLYNFAQATLNPGDEVIIPAPYWVSYPPIVKLAGAKPVIINTTLQQRFKITAEQLEAAITPQTRCLMLNSPNNPSGMAYTADEFSALGKVLLKHPDVLIAVDDIYEYIFWGKKSFVTLLNVCPELTNRVIIFNGVSKAYAMTGWRIGYAAGPAPIIQAMKKIQSQNTTCADSIAQVAATTALGTEPHHLDYMFEAYKERHDVVHQALNGMPGVHCLDSDGTFYLFPDVSEATHRLGLTSDIELATHLLKKAYVAVVPGTAFGSPGHVRISIAASLEKLKEAMDRLLPLFAT